MGHPDHGILKHNRNGKGWATQPGSLSNEMQIAAAVNAFKPPGAGSASHNKSKNPGIAHILANTPAGSVSLALMSAAQGWNIWTTRNEKGSATPASAF
jgi:hypothetical protein